MAKSLSRFLSRTSPCHGQVTTFFGMLTLIQQNSHKRVVAINDKQIWKLKSFGDGEGR